MKTNQNPAPKSEALRWSSPCGGPDSGSDFRRHAGDAGLFKSNFALPTRQGHVGWRLCEGGAFGELYSTARRVVDKDVESWTVE